MMSVSLIPALNGGIGAGAAGAGCACAAITTGVAVAGRLLVLV